MSGHGWVIPNADGSHARCGGPSICQTCALEFAQLHAGEKQVEITCSAWLEEWEAEARRTRSEARHYVAGGGTHYVELVTRAKTIEEICESWRSHSSNEKLRHPAGKTEDAQKENNQ